MTTQPEIQSLVDQYFQPLVNTSNPYVPNATQAPGGICGVLYDGDTYYFPYGYMNSSGDAPTEDTVFGLGSVTKTLTTTLLGMGRDFNDPVLPYLPAGYNLQPTEQPLTWAQVATFTGGIPSVPPTGQSTTQAQFIDFINGITPGSGGLPAPNVYSDSSIGFLAQLLMSIAGYTSFDGANTNTWWTQSLLTLLFMNNTGYPAPTDNSHPLSTAYEYDPGNSTYVATEYAGWVPWGAAGRAYSTCSDMMIFVMANAGIATIGGNSVPQDILDAMVVAQKPWAPPEPPNAEWKQGFAWQVREPDSENPFVGKAGGVPGVSSYVTAMPTQQLGIVFLTNMQHVKTQDAALELTKALQAL